MEGKCISCKKEIMNDSRSVKFKCPKCGKQLITRCGHCRQIASRYTCPECGFTGPN